MILDILMSVMIGLFFGYQWGYKKGKKEGMELAIDKAPLQILVNSLEKGYCLICGREK